MRKISNNPAIQSHYELCLSKGTSETLSEMFALGQAPMSNTDREFLEGWCNGNQFEGQPRIGDMYKKEADAVGVNPVGKRYMSSLADYPGDPTAWVSGRGDVQRICEDKGIACRGSVNYTPPAPVSVLKDVSLADDIVSDKVAEIVGGLPEADRPHVDTLDLAEQVKEVMTPHWSKNGSF